MWLRPCAVRSVGVGDVAVMGLHKLTAGDGYLYLLRQVAASDGTDLGRTSLADYYTTKGETPGHWTGSGLLSRATPVTETPATQHHRGPLSPCPTGRRSPKNR